MPRYRQLADYLRRQIAAGTLTGRLPGEKHLMQDYGLSQGTVRKALAILRDEGLVETTAGLGTYVVSKPPRNP